jgi:hypothetical protein
VGCLQVGIALVLGVAGTVLLQRKAFIYPLRLAWMLQLVRAPFETTANWQLMDML